MNTNSTSEQIRATDYAISYSSRWTQPEVSKLTPESRRVLAHVNCSYLSSGQPPTLLALKQHAQSLTALIRFITTSDDFMDVNNQQGEAAMIADEYTTFDWLNNLDEPYQTRDDYHKKPLWALVNNIESEDETAGIKKHCALTTYEEERREEEENALRGVPVQPFRSHAMLVEHANECLEQLDLEYKASGGLLSLINDEEEELPGIRNCLLGQWLLQHQHLAARAHELEINYGQALDLLDGKALIPTARNTHGVEVGKARIAVMPQDKFIITHTDKDLVDTIHDEMDRRETRQEEGAAEWRVSNTTTGRLLTNESDGKQVERGIVAFDTVSRFYRLKGRGRNSPIFIEPACMMRSGAQHRDELRKHPTVVGVPAPAWPERLTDIEERYRGKDMLIKEMEDDRERLAIEVAELTSELSKMAQELEELKGRSGNGEASSAR